MSPLIEVSAARADALLAGTGHLLRDGSIEGQRFTGGPWRGTREPGAMFRAAYLATHFGNWYEAAPLPEVCRYLEDLGLWGYNTILVHYPTHQFDRIDDDRSVEWLTRIKAMFKAARACGLRVGLLQCSNQGLKSTPESWRGRPIENRRGGNLGFNCCMSKPEALAGIVELYDALFERFTDIGCDDLVFWPYDEGGCLCDDCTPWGARGFLKISRLIGQRAVARFPDLRITVSTWRFPDEQEGDPSGEWPAFYKAITADHSWFHCIMADGADEVNGFVKYLLDHPLPGDLPLVSFPEISMYAGEWGSKGALCSKRRFQNQWQNNKPLAQGGAVYSEGIYEDMNKVLWAGWWWQPSADPNDIVRSYAAWEFGSQVGEDACKAIDLLDTLAGPEKTHRALEANKLLSAAEDRLDQDVKSCWRWRLLRLRGIIETEMATAKEGKPPSPAYREAVEELTRIYHAESAWPRCKPQYLIT